jgi:ribosomal protein S14
MPRKYLTIKDKKHRRQFQRIEKKRRWQQICNRNTTSLDEQRRLVYEVQRLPKFRTKNFCILTGKGRSVYRFFHLSRHMLRKHAGFGNLVGVKKSSW